MIRSAKLCRSGPMVTLLVWCCLTGNDGRAQAPPPTPSWPTNSSDVIVLPGSVPDPLEPFNRTMWALNRGLLVGVVKPTSKVYRFVVRKPIRTGVANFGRNITYPGRFINHLLQARWSGARYETDRFFCNTIAGGAGFLDVATMWKIPKSDADFGQTFGRWGWRPTFYLMIPIMGPSNDRDVVGLAADNAANPLTYITPYSITTDNPLTFFSPYVYFTYAVIYNNLSDSVDGYVRFVTAETDPYSLMQYAWTFVRETRTPDLRLTEEQDQVSLETLQSALVSVADAKFPDRGTTSSVKIPATGRNLKFDYWLQPRGAARAPVVYLVPGLGSHRRVELNLVLAEMLYRNGFSVISVSSPFNPEFMENGSASALPGYAPVDAHELHVALTGIDERLAKKYPERLGRRALVGYSMGGFQSFMVAALRTNESSLMHFDRFVAIDTPVRLLQGVTRLDEFFNAPHVWPAEERTARIENIFLKVAAAAPGGIRPQSAVPLSATESKFLIGLAFRFILRDVIYSSQRREDQKILQQPLTRLRRKPVYSEILEYSFQDYFEKFATPYYRLRLPNDATADTLAEAGDLRTYGPTLQADPRLRAVVNENDFLLTPEDLVWLRTTLGPDHLRVFPRGGHLGNLGDPQVQAAIVAALSGL